MTFLGLSSGASWPSRGRGLALPAPRVNSGKGDERLSVGKLMDDGKFLEAMERALYAKLLDKLDSDAWDDCGQVVKLLEGLSII